MNENFAKERSYDKFNLIENPFPYSPVPDDNPEIYSGQEHVRKTLEDVLGTAISTSQSNHLVVTGKYGNGKSHTLKYAQKIAEENSNCIVGYVPQPGSSFLDIYHEFMYDLGYDFFQNLAYEYLAEIANSKKVDSSKEIKSAEEMKEAIDDGDALLSDLIPGAIRELKDISKFIDFSRAFVHLVYEDTSLYSWQWLSGEGLRYEQRKKMEIHTDLDDDTKAVKAFTSVKKLVRHLNYDTLCLFVDEFESISRLKSNRKQSVLNSLRHVMDMNPHGISIVIACAPEIWQDVMSEYHAFSERIGREVALKPLNKEKVEDLIREYLKKSTNDGQNTINPFTESAIDEILTYSQGNIRRTISLCSQALDEAVDKGREKVDQKLVETVMN